MSHPFARSFGILALVALAAAPSAQGETVASLESQAPTPAAQAAAPSKFGLLLSTAYNTDRRSPSDPDAHRDLNFSANPTYKLAPKTTLTAVFSATKDLVDERDLNWEDGYLGATQRIGTAGPDTKFSLIGRGYIPISEASKDYATLRTRLYLAPQVLVGPETLRLPLSVLYRPYGTVSFHRYEVGLDGRSNTQYGLSHRLALDVEITEKLSLSLDNIYGRSWTYTGKTKDNYSFDQSLAYQLTDALSASAGHNIGGSPLRPNGREVAIELFDDNVSTFYLGLDFQL